ncbi:MAG: radical SAM protein [Elusimicrobia bacterium]|nr:radical SAM protein [Elusimicrobiota bacterium]
MIAARLRLARERFLREGDAHVALAVLPSPDYDVATFNLSSAELAGYLRHMHPELRDRGVHFIEPDVALSRSEGLARSVDYCLEALRRIKPHVLGISAKIGSHGYLLELLAALRREPWTDSCVLLVGNVLATFSHDVFSERHPEALFVIGDGEQALETVYRSLKDESIRLEDIPNAAYRLDGELRTTPRRMLDHARVDWLPAFDMLDTAIERQADIIVRATTGCPASCTFCSIKAINLETQETGRLKDMGWESYPPGRTARVFALLQSRGVRHVNLADDEFGNMDFRFIEAFADVLLAQGNEITFNVSMRLDAFWSPGMSAEETDSRRRVLRKIARAGMKQLFVGAESGSPSQLRRYGKGYPVEVNYRTVEILLEEGIQPCLGFIPFDVFVTRAEIEANLAFLETKVGGRALYELVASPVNVMRVQRATPYERLLQRRGLLRGLEDNLTFYRVEFVDPRMGAVALAGQDWFREILSLRYPTIQLYRMSATSHNFDAVSHRRSEAVIRALHRLDVEYIRALLAVFDGEAEPTEMLDPGRNPLVNGFAGLEQARAVWAESARGAASVFAAVTRVFRDKRLPLEMEMRELLDEAYQPQAKSVASWLPPPRAALLGAQGFHRRQPRGLESRE